MNPENTFRNYHTIIKLTRNISKSNCPLKSTELNVANLKKLQNLKLLLSREQSESSEVELVFHINQKFKNDTSQPSSLSHLLIHWIN